MSRGLGKMQRMIMDELSTTPGGRWIERPWSFDIDVPEGVYDLRMVSKELARRHGGLDQCGCITAAWEASYSRAVRGLTKRGMINHNGNHKQQRFVQISPQTAKTDNA